MTAFEAAEAAVLRRIEQSIPLTGELRRPTRSQAGAVGHVVGVRAVDGSDYALKIYPTDQRHKAETEAAALRRLRNIGIPVPEVVLVGAVDEPVGFVLMRWLPGRRWAECRPEMSIGQAQELIEQAGRLLRRTHAVTGPWFGDLLREPPVHPTPVDVVAARLDRLVRNYRQVGGRDEMVVRMLRFVGERYPALSMCETPVLCHNDFNGGNLMVRVPGPPLICGVFDLEAASWGDPMDDLALSFLHFRSSYPELVGTVVQSYGIGEEHERLRLQAFEALRLMDERCWISSDRPAGWQRSIAVLDGRLDTLLRMTESGQYGR